MVDIVLSEPEHSRTEALVFVAGCVPLLSMYIWSIVYIVGYPEPYYSRLVAYNKKRSLL